MYRLLTVFEILEERVDLLLISFLYLFCELLSLTFFSLENELLCVLIFEVIISDVFNFDLVSTIV